MESDLDGITKAAAAEATAAVREVLQDQAFRDRERLLHFVESFGQVLASLENVITSDPAEARRVAAEVREEIEEMAQTIRSHQAGYSGEGDIDQESLGVFVLNDETVAEADAAVAETLDNVPVGDWGPPGEEANVPLFGHTMKDSVDDLRSVGVTTLQDLKAELARRKAEIAAFADEWTQPLVEKRGRPRGGVLQGGSVSYLAKLSVAQTRDPATVEGFLRAKGLGLMENIPGLDEGPGERFSVEEEARRMIRCYESIIGEDM